MYCGGYTGKILRLNLTERTAREESLPLETARDFIGGTGLGIKYLFDEVPAGIDPLGPENKLIFAVGPFTGTTLPATSRMAVTGKSPLTNAVGSALSGGYFPVELKRAGYDALIIEGKADKPTYISIREGMVRFRDSAKVWGLKTTDCQQIIKDDLNDQNIRVACIGPAGEHLSKLACIINEYRAMGRKGLGAVMGSKNLKAIAVRGNGSVAIADQEKYDHARKEMLAAFKESPVLYPVFSKLGSSCAFTATTELGIFSARNWTATGAFVPIKEIGVDAQEAQKIGKTGCFGCPVACARLSLAKNAPYTGTLSEGPEFETQYSFGGQTGVDNLDAIIAADRLADELGLDTISAGVTIGFAMELSEKGLLTSGDTGGMDITFGSHQAMLALLRMMAYREGIGDLLADGVKAAAQRIGNGADRYAMHIKGLELPAYDVRGAKAHGVNYATAYSGADHNRGYAPQEIFGMPIPYAVDRLSIEGKGKLAKWNQDIQTALADCPTICSFTALMALLEHGAEIVARLMEGVTGLVYTPEEILRVGERVNNLARAFNVREGFTRKDDTLPERLMTEPIPDGPSKGQLISKEDLNRMLDEYYTARGWNLTTGAPTRGKLTELGIGYVADALGL
ncbi:MAG: aldehyde ferredoxin oxidoreductase family protein [Deltaproteobacteria bacterium]|nr:aldehyde ferredoxin oxidoreductase family protein [Deltaproteobacteria bacterium]